MTTAELLKKREEEKNNPQISATPPSISAPKPAEGMNMAEARMAGNSDMPSEPVKQPGTPLYDAGVSFGQIAKEASVKNPITTPEYENFRNEVIGAKQFGVETPEQAEARERRDFIKQGLTGFTEGLSALANLYYTTKWAPNQKQVSQMPVLQQQLYRERLERDKKLENFRAWQRAKADKAEEREYNLNLFNLKQEAAQKAAEKKAKLDEQAAEIKYLRELGLIDARKAADLEKQIGKAALDKELEGIRQKNRIELKKTTSASDDKILDSVHVGEDVYTRNSKLTDNELRALSKYVQHPEEFTTVTGADPDLGIKGKETFDWKSAAINAIESGSVPSDVLRKMGFKKRQASNQDEDRPPSRREKGSKENDNVPPSRRK